MADNTPQQKQKQEAVSEAPERARDIADVIRLTIAPVMRDRSAMKNMEVELDKYLGTLTPEQKLSMKSKMRDQLIDGRLAMEYMLQRMLSSIG